jgi:hypothetical protein
MLYISNQMIGWGYRRLEYGEKLWWLDQYYNVFKGTWVMNGYGFRNRPISGSPDAPMTYRRPTNILTGLVCLVEKTLILFGQFLWKIRLTFK